jgi:branched-chain amino acid transport system permease protein
MIRKGVINLKDLTTLSIIGFLVISLLILFIGSQDIIAFFLTLIELLILTYSINIITGLTGYVDFGHAVFYGIGAYTTAFLIVNTNTMGVMPYLFSLIGGLVAAFIALLIGAPVLRLKGAYFAIATLSVSEAAKVIVSNIPALGGAYGIPLARYVSYNVVSAYLAMWLTLLFAIALTIWISNSKFGYGLRAIREDEIAANVMGINTTLYKLIAYVLSAFIAGVIGGISGVLYVYVSTEYFKVDISVKILVSMMLGGQGTILGPLIGAILYYAVQYTLVSSYPFLHLLIFGTILIIVVLFIPEGLVGIIKRKSKLKLR